MRYGNTGKNKENGVVYTPAEIAQFVAAEMLKYHSKMFSDAIDILDPAAGTGELLISMIQAAKKFNRKINIVGYETDQEVAAQTQQKLITMFPDVRVEIRTADFIHAVENSTVEKFDFVIANPPYIRTQIMGSDKAQKLARNLSLSGRIDIYYVFLLYTKNVLNHNGIAGFITSNKFLTIKAGNAVRNYMQNNYQIHHIIDLGDTKLFKAAVLPCIVVFSSGKTDTEESVAFTSVYQTRFGSDSRETARINHIFEAIDKSGRYQLPDGREFEFKQGKIQNTDQSSLWTLASHQNQDWLETVAQNTCKTFESLGKIKVGIKTTADNVFIGNDWTGDKAGIELLKPLITHRNAGQFVSNNKDYWQVLYTHFIENGKKMAYDLELYPKAKSYLMKHFEQLNGRNYIKKAKRNWYEIWVPQNPEAWQHRKIVFRDISERPEFWLDETGAVVNGDCYWIDIDPQTPEAEIYLALAVANSTFIEKFYDIKFNTKLYSGKRRYQSQYVSQFPIPYYDHKLGAEAISLVKKIIAAPDPDSTVSYKKELDLIVSKMFLIKKVSR